MKTTALLLLRLQISFLILLAFSTNPLLMMVKKVAAQSELEAVRDIQGNIVRAGVDYYILPVFRGSGGGLTLGNNRNGTNCPLDVVQEPHEVNNGLPVTFTPVDPKKGVIRILTDQNIQFSASTICIQSTLWKLDSSDGTDLRRVTTGGSVGNPGRETLSNWFKIEKFDNDYKLVFCPTVCNFCRPACGNLGIYIDSTSTSTGGVRRLAISDLPLKVVFKKA